MKNLEKLLPKAVVLALATTIGAAACTPNHHNDKPAATSPAKKSAPSKSFVEALPTTTTTVESPTELFNRQFSEAMQTKLKTWPEKIVAFGEKEGYGTVHLYELNYNNQSSGVYPNEEISETNFSHILNQGAQKAILVEPGVGQTESTGDTTPQFSFFLTYSISPTGERTIDYMHIFEINYAGNPSEQAGFQTIKSLMVAPTGNNSFSVEAQSSGDSLVQEPTTNFNEVDQLLSYFDSVIDS